MALVIHFHGYILCSMNILQIVYQLVVIFITTIFFIYLYLYFYNIFILYYIYIILYYIKYIYIFINFYQLVASREFSKVGVELSEM